MRGRIPTLLMTCALTTVISGCGKEPPKCSDNETISLVRQIIFEQIGGSEGLTEKEIKENLKVELPRASAFDEKIKKYSCEAKLIAGDMYQLPITYESQADDKGQHIVSVGGINRVDLIGVQSGVIEGIKKSRANTTNTAKPDETPSTQKTTEPPISTPAQVAPSNSVPTENTSSEGKQPSPQPTWAPSFDCAKATTFSEKAVCNDPLLGKLDGALSQNYKYMLASDIGDGARSDLKATQKKWLSERNKCTDNECLTNSYRKRIDEICDYPVISGVHPICTGSDEIK